MPQLLKVQNLFLSSDGFGAGEGQSLERPFGHANPAELASWAGATASWPNRTDPGGSRGLDDYFTRDFANNIGAEIMGRNKFSPYRGPHDLEWQGWWGDEPPFHTPVFVLTHYSRPSLTLSDTTFHFVDGEPAAAAGAGPVGEARGGDGPRHEHAGIGGAERPLQALALPGTEAVTREKEVLDLQQLRHGAPSEVVDAGSDRRRKQNSSPG